MVMLFSIAGPLSIGVTEEVKAPNESYATPAATTTGTKTPDLERMYVGSWTSPATFRDNASFTLAWSEAEGRLQATAYTYTDRGGSRIWPIECHLGRRTPGTRSRALLFGMSRSRSLTSSQKERSI